MKLPKQLEELRNRKVWLCYPMIWNDTKHNGVGGYDKPPINPYTLRNGSSNDPSNLATYDEAVAQIGKMAYVSSKNFTGNTEIKGVGIAFGGTGICGLDLDNVAILDETGAFAEYVFTEEATEIIELLNTYTEISPSGNGLHLLFFGKLPENIKKIAKPKEDFLGTDKAEYQLFDSGYMTITGKGSKPVSSLSDKEIQNFYDLYFDDEVVEPISTPSTERPAASKSRYNPFTKSSSVVSGTTGITYERWLKEIEGLSDAEILDRIFLSGKTGSAVKSLYDGNIFQYDNDHSRADQALCTYLYGFTNSSEMTERLFRSSKLYRAKGKSRNYLSRTIKKASENCIQLIGHIEFTKEEKRAFAQQKAKEDSGIDFEAAVKGFDSYTKRNSNKPRYNPFKKGGKHGRKKI